MLKKQKGKEKKMYRSFQNIYNIAQERIKREDVLKTFPGKYKL